MRQLKPKSCHLHVNFQFFVHHWMKQQQQQLPPREQLANVQQRNWSSLRVESRFHESREIHVDSLQDRFILEKDAVKKRFLQIEMELQVEENAGLNQKLLQC